MKSRFKSKLDCFKVWLGIVAVFGLYAAHGQEIFLQADWLVDVAAPAAAIWSGGNASSGTTLDAPNAGGICLAESAIGQITPQFAGSPNAVQGLESETAANLAAGNAYQTQNGVSAPAVAWYNTLIFPGGFDPVTGSNYASGVASTYNVSDILQADYDLRALLEINPGDTNSAQQLILLTEDQMLPLEWSGAEAMTYANYARLNGLTQNGTNRETLCVEEARGYYQNACNVFGQFLSNPFNADLVEGQNPLLSSAVTNQVAEVLDDYLRDVNGYAQASLADFQLRQLAGFYDPTVSGSVPPQALLSDIDNTVSRIQMWLMLASPFQKDLAAVGAAYTTAQAGQINGLLHDMRRLHKSILLGRITFETGASGESESGDPSLNYGEFTTAFVPFFSGLADPGNSSFDVAFTLAQSFTSYAATEESAASSDIQNVLQGAYTWASDQNSLQNQYLTELENLCGYFYDTNGNPNPDIFFAALPPGLREQTANQVLPPGSYQLANTGTIYQQWLTLESAETNLLLAQIQLSNTLATMVSDTLVADAIYSNQVQYAALILTNGNEISAIDQQEGQVQASADQQIEQINATTAQEQANNSFWGGIGSGILSGIASAASAFATGGASAAEGDGATGGAQIINAFTTQANGYDQASSDLQIGSVEANEATQLADLNAQISQINASEQAQEQYVNADTTMLNLSANLSALRLQANSQEVQIQLAAQQVDQAKSQLATMLAQAGSLINQWTRSASLINQNPAFSSDLLVIQDTTIQQAGDAFALAQEWAFLAALSFNYKDNCPNAQNFVPSVLAARRTSDLMPVLEQMESANTLITSGCQSSPLYGTVQFSLRNNYVQANQTTVTGTNTVVTSYEPVLEGGIVSSSATASEAAWSNYLASCIITNKYGERVLILNFATSLDNQIVAETQFNPLFTCETFGTTLYSGQDNNGNQMHGVQVSLSTQGFNPPLGASSGFEVVLSQLGTSVIRNRGFGNQTEPTPGFRYFNFGNFGVGITASENNLTGNGGTGTFQARSPANSQWQLSINAADSENNEALINNLGDLTDIQFQFSIQSYVDQIAVQNCNSP